MSKNRFISFRTKPRNPVKTVKWFEYFAQLEGQNYNHSVQRNGTKVHPVRETYIKLAHPEVDLKKTAPPSSRESQARQEKVTYELFGFGYIDNDGTIQVTKAGREILEKKNKRDELMLRQMLKYQFPNYVNSTVRYEDMEVVLMEVVLKMIDELEYLNRYEAAISLMFCCHRKEIPRAIEVVKEYRNRAEKIGNKSKDTMETLFFELADKYYPDISLNKISSHLSTIDALFRYLEYTSLFIQSGRGHYSRISFREMAKEKIDLLLNEYEFKFNDNWSDIFFFNIFGDPYYYNLPWDEQSELFRITLSNLNDIKQRVNKHCTEIPKDNEYLEKIENLTSTVKEERNNPDSLQQISDEVRDLSVTVNEDIFLNITSKTDELRNKILEKIDDIIQEKKDEDSLALWFENITWKSLAALCGEHDVKRNFKIETDLSPRFYAPGAGNTPDIEYYNNEFVIITEVSLTSGVAQWKAEGGSVVDHVNSFIKAKIGDAEEKGDVKKNDEREIIGLFLAKSINSRILWLFHALNNNSWLKTEMPIIPFKLKKYKEIIKKLYEEDLDAEYFEKFLFTLHRAAKSCNNVTSWEERKKELTERFIREPVDYIKFNY